MEGGGINKKLVTGLKFDRQTDRQTGGQNGYTRPACGYVLMCVKKRRRLKCVSHALASKQRQRVDSTLIRSEASGAETARCRYCGVIGPQCALLERKARARIATN